jgi:hypothetical protein
MLIQEHPEKGLPKLVALAHELGWQVSLKRMKRLKQELAALEAEVLVEEPKLVPVPAQLVRFICHRQSESKTPHRNGTLSSAQPTLKTCATRPTEPTQASP